MTNEEAKNIEGYLSGKLLIAMPSMADPRFSRAVIYVCAHNEQGAMGIVINRPMERMQFEELLDQLEIDSSHLGEHIDVFSGGPVETGRGFVLHSTDYLQNSSLKITSNVALTASLDILRDIAGGHGPNKKLFALGYAGWGPGQLDEEMLHNGWLSLDPNLKLIFGQDLDKWEQSLAMMGLDPAKLSFNAGHA